MIQSYTYKEDSPNKLQAKAESPKKLFCNMMPYDSISQTLTEHIIEISHGELAPFRVSCASTEMNSLLADQQQMEASFAKIQNNQQPSPIKPISSKVQELSENKSQISESTVKLQSNLHLFHKETFQFLLKMNSNKKKLREAEAIRKIKRELNIDDNMSCASFSRSKMESRSVSLTSKSLMDSGIFKKREFVKEKENTIQSILVQSYCKSFPNMKKYRKRTTISK